MRTELPRILTAARLTGSNNAHPFLDKINPQDYSRLTAYYAGYLTQKIVYIDKQLEKLARGKVNIQFHPTRKLIRQSQTDSVEHAGMPRLLATATKKMLRDLLSAMRAFHTPTGEITIFW